ncbi:MAG: hypothetical protein WCH62_03475 [Candidatus Omnitrophota bacterium]
MSERENIEYKLNWHDDYLKIEKIINACKDAQLPELEIEENSGGLLVTLFNRSIHPSSALLSSSQGPRKGPRKSFSKSAEDY